MEQLNGKAKEELNEDFLFREILFNGVRQIPIQEMYNFLTGKNLKNFCVQEHTSSWFIQWESDDNEKDFISDYDVIYKNRILSSISAKGYLFLKKYNIKFNEEKAIEKAVEIFNQK